MVVLTVAVSAPAVAADARYSRQDGEVAALARVVPGPVLVLLPAKPGFIMFPHYNLGQVGALGGPVVYAAASGTARDFDLLQHFSDRIPYFITFSGSFLPHRPHLGAQLNRVVQVHGRSIDLRAQASPARLRNTKLALTVRAGGPALDCGRPDRAGGWSIHVAPNGDLTCTGAGSPVVAVAGADPSIRLKYSSKSGAEDEVDIPARVSAGNVTLLLPGPLAALLRQVTPALTVHPVG
jgi:hypothetical protein